jgi:hypothetical protein
MMASKQGAFQDLQRLSMQLRNIIEIAPELATIASLEQAKAEAQAALDHVRGLMTEERNRHDATLAAEREKIIATAHRDAARIKSDAETGVASLQAMIDRANADAARVKSDAEAAASVQRESVAAAQAQLAEINSRIAALKTIETDWGAKAVAAKAEHDRIQSIHQEFVSKVGLR